MSKIYFHLTCLCAGFSGGALISTLSKGNEMMQLFRNCLYSLYFVIPIIYLCLILVGIERNKEELLSNLYSIFSLKTLPYFVLSIVFLMALIIYHNANNLVLYG